MDPTARPPLHLVALAAAGEGAATASPRRRTRAQRAAGGAAWIRRAAAACSHPERIRAASPAAVHGDELVARPDDVEDAVHVGAEAQAGHRQAGDGQAVREVADGEAGVVHDLAAGITGKAVAGPVEPVLRRRELHERVEVRYHLAELRIALLDEEDVAVPVVHDGLAHGVTAQHAGRAERAGDTGNDLERRVDLHEGEVAPDPLVDGLHHAADRREGDD